MKTRIVAMLAVLAASAWCQGSLDRTTLTVAWKDTSIEDCLASVRRATGLNFVVAPAARELVQKTVSLELKEVRTRAVLGLLADQGGFAWTTKDGILQVTTPEEAAKARLVTAVYDIREHLYSPPDFPAPVVLGLRPGKPVVPEETETAREEKDPNRLVDLVRTMTGAKPWEVEGSSITASRGLLVVRHTPEVQAQVRAALSKLRGAW